ncbi:VOC family protein [Nitratireductor basaltis]|uniref:3-demethylubiquinone-9 3-methyltransferase n=1 Tax=Nitratireductor basaltis TaxID=472175 RepID=A0A084U9D6_9HYPH|nr:VOC family protein [Nitratireductor basaltis]KFB09572.1 3-demethylubiquinone-9 3-methyltransferase [Nitratireductor basaltis]
MKVLANIDFDGDCREAFTSYAEIVGGEIKAMISHRDMPGMAGDVQEDQKDRIIHAWIDIGDQALMGQDMQDFSGRKGMGVTVAADTKDEAKRIFDALADGGSVQIPFGEQPWSKGFGLLNDRWGVTWVIDTADAA